MKSGAKAVSENKNIILRKATLLDLPKLLPLMYQYLPELENHGKLTDEDKNAVSRTVFLALLTGSVIMLVAEIAKKKQTQLVGYGVFDVRPDIFGDLMAWGHQLYVDKEYRRLAVSDMLVAEVERLAAELGAKKFYIDTPMPEYFMNKFGYGDLYRVVVKDLEVKANVE